MFFSSLNRVINVPITDDNIAKRVNSLPRSEDNSGMVNVGLKRKLNMKNYHKHGLINPNRVYKACEYLVKNHPAYKEIRLKSYDEWAEKQKELKEKYCLATRQIFGMFTFSSEMLRRLARPCCSLCDDKKVTKSSLKRQQLQLF